MESIDKIDHRHPGVAKDEIIQFLNTQLRPGENFSIAQEYPSLFGEFPGGKSLVLRKEREILSHAGYVVRDFQFGEQHLKVGIVGSVATASEYRKKGMASKLVSEIVAELRTRGCQMCLLWSVEQEFYEKFGFYRCGKELNFRFDPTEMPSPLENIKVVRMDRKKHGNKIWRLYQKHAVKIDRSLEEQNELFEIPRAKVYVSEQEGKVVAYVVVNKGADFKNYIHEWGGPVKEIQKLIIWLQKMVFSATRLTMIAPSNYDMEAIRQISSVEHMGVLGLMKIIDRSSLVGIYRRFLSLHGADFEINKSGTELSFEGTSIPFESDQDFLQTMFGVGGQETTAPTLPFFLWGFDSI